MIISKDVNPKKDLYFLGGKVLEEITKTNKREYDFMEIFYKLKSENDISLNLFSLVLAWLFLIDAINYSEKGNIIKCF